MRTYILTVDTGYGHSIEAIVSAETAGKAKYKAWLKSDSDAGYWDNFLYFVCIARLEF